MASAKRAVRGVLTSRLFSELRLSIVTVVTFLSLVDILRLCSVHSKQDRGCHPGTSEQRGIKQQATRGEGCKMGFEGSGTTTRIQSSLDKSQKGQFRKQKSRRRRTTTYYHMRPAREKRKEQRPWAKRWAYDLGALRRRASTGIGWRGEHGWRDVRWKRAGTYDDYLVVLHVLCGG